MVSCCFNLHFPDDIWCGAFSHMLICHLYILFGEVSVQVYGLFFHQVVFLLLSFKRSLYILENSFLSDGSFANILFQSVAYLLILNIPFAQQKLLILMKSSLSIISSMDHAFDVVYKKSLLHPRSSKFSMLSSRSFIVLHFTLKSVICFFFFFKHLY